MSPAPKNKFRLFGLVFAGLLLVGAIAMQFARVPDVKDGVKGGGQASGDLLKLLPESTGGWLGREEPLGPSEFVSGAAARILNFDDYAYRIYRKGGRTFGVYVAYWAPGRMPTHKVASHTPDRCWVENGWKCDEYRFAVPVTVGAEPLKPAEWRRFSPPGGAAAGGTQYVLYWHLVGDQLYDYGERLNTRPHPVKWMRDSISYALKGSQGQYFIRLTSDRPMDDLLIDPSLNSLWESLAQLGLRRETI